MASRIWNRMITKIQWLRLGIFILAFGVLVSSASALNATVCCEKTTTGLFCQNVPSDQCAPGSRQVPSSCESVSYCKPGVCYDSNEGTCSGNTPQLVCNNNKGVWSEQAPAQCNLGCCLLGDQAAFVSLVRCKKLSAFLGLDTNYNTGIKDEVQCVLAVQNQDKGACVYDQDFEKTCKFTTRAECSAGVNGTGKGTFFKGKLCSAEELGTICGPTKKTLCIPGKDEVYFVDSCGNQANIYDASKVNDKDYWTNVKDKSESCSPNGANANSAACGNCNYLLGSVCRSADTKKATYGDYMCADLNCKNTQDGNSYKHGESWCVYNDQGTNGQGEDSVGSRFFKHICINGEEVLEQCADFRQEECIQDKIQTSQGTFSQAACRVNRWQDCTAQISQLDCENTDRRDCYWKPDVKLSQFEQNETITGVCLPKNPPGLKFWEGQDAQTICAQGNSACIVTFEKGLFGGEKCSNNCDCLSEDWQKQRSDICLSLGDCGPNVNWIGQQGYKPGYNISITNVK
ncbi:hypothetical protein KW787_03030 [Candidatus Pacearchaeota archaeon]|nr:hypothetical protein [Candidatus Pacearchaeota archaeon]